ncbi:hypothetical protein [Paractinoplanes rishiriensis]|uniref:Uncharacterized protein n=1 Tax=Paractinoplanes rishiriensis TaxID=1050105 RepID=A0A919JWA3_9ACTN|nr:hypothetical protein [Actinoplanes rishiriensis]GIE94622.1 hypothetical protein Ari01nite_20870 [Actinoplanes rishiriensis]
MTSPLPNRRIDQVFFGFSQQGGEQRVLADSFDGPDEHLRWQHRLQAHIRLQPLADADLPRRALSYFSFADGKAALLNRVDAGVSAGRNNAHALIGPSELLTPRTALGLSFWTGWQVHEPVAPLEPIHTGLGNTLKQAENHFYPAAVKNIDTLKPILAGLLTDPNVPISVIGCPEDIKLVMIWALLEIDECARTGLPNRSFSTYEDRHDAGVERAPHLMFLPVRPYTTGNVPRTIVDLAYPLAAGPAADTAAQLCRQLVERSFAPLAPAQAARPKAVLTETRPAPPQRYEARSGIPAPSPEQQLVAALRNAPTVRAFDQVLEALEQHPAERRHLVRAALDAAALDAAAFQVEVTFREELLTRLLTAAYGPRLEDLGDPQAEKHAVEVAGRANSEQLALLLGGMKATAGGPIRAAAFQRWAADGRAGRREPVAGILRRLRARRRDRYLPVAAVIAVLAVLGTAFLGGVLLGRSDGTAGNRPAAAPSTTRPASEPPESGPAGGRPRSGYATFDGVKPDDVAVIAFTRTAGGLQLQGLCVLAWDTTWFCPGRGDLPPDLTATLVAYAVPKEQVAEALTAPLPAAPNGWSAEHQVQ